MMKNTDEDVSLDNAAKLQHLRLWLRNYGFLLLPAAWGISELSGIEFMTILATLVFAAGIGLLLSVQNIRIASKP